MRDASQCGKQRERLLISVSLGLQFLGSREAAGVVIAKHYHHIQRIGKHHILSEMLIDASQTLIPIICRLIGKIVQIIHQREIHHRWQMGIAWRELAIFLPIGTTHNVVNPCFAHNVKARILSLDGFAPTHHLVEIVIWIGVLADAIDVHPFNPPNACLNQIIHHQAILMIEVGHGLHKPSVGSVFVAGLSGVWVIYGCCAIRCRHKLAIIVEPIVARTVGKQEVLAAAMVKHNVKYVFNAFGVCCLNETLGFVHRAVARIGFIEIGDGIAMKRLLWHIVFQYRSGPNSCHTKVAQIVETLFQTCQVATVTCFLSLWVAALLLHAGYAIVFRVAVGKTVGHQQIHHIARIE